MAKRTKLAQEKREFVRASIPQPPEDVEGEGTSTRPATRLRNIGLGGVSAEIEQGPLAQKLLDAGLRGFGINVQLSPEEPPVWVNVRSAWVEPIEGGVVGGFEFLGLDKEVQEKVIAYLKSDLQRRVIEACNEADTDKELEKRLVALLKERGAIS